LIVRILGLLWKFLMLSSGLMLLVGGLVCSILGLGSSVDSFAATVGLAAAGLGCLLVWAAMRRAGGQGRGHQPTPVDAGR
jgi:hypothetical protein